MAFKLIDAAQERWRAVDADGLGSGTRPPPRNTTMPSLSSAGSRATWVRWWSLSGSHRANHTRCDSGRLVERLRHVVEYLPAREDLAVSPGALPTASFALCFDVQENDHLQGEPGFWRTSCAIGVRTSRHANEARPTPIYSDLHVHAHARVAESADATGLGLGAWPDSRCRRMPNHAVDVHLCFESPDVRCHRMSREIKRYVRIDDLVGHGALPPKRPFESPTGALRAGTLVS